MTDELLNHKLAEYAQLHKMQKQISSRLETLNKQIKDELWNRAEREVHPGESIVHEHNKLIAVMKVKQVRQKPDEGMLAQLIVDKNLWADCTRVKVDPDLVEQAYIEGKLTDDDLRSISAGSQIQLALSVQEMEVPEIV